MQNIQEQIKKLSDIYSKLSAIQNYLTVTSHRLYDADISTYTAVHDMEKICRQITTMQIEISESISKLREDNAIVQELKQIEGDMKDCMRRIITDASESIQNAFDIYTGIYKDV